MPVHDVFVFGVLMERLFIQWLLRLDPLYNFLLTFGITLFLVDLVKRRYGVSSLPYELPAGLEGRLTIGSVSLSSYQIFVAGFSLALCLAVWLLLTTGFLGGYTTFSTLTANTWELFEGGQINAALLNAFGSLALGIAATALGFACGRWWHA